MVEATCSHCVLPPMRKPVSSMCLTGAAATWSRTASAKPSEALGAVLADPGDGGRGQPHAEQIGHQRGETLLGQQLIVQQVEHQGADPLAVLHRCGHPIGESLPASVPRTPRNDSHARGVR